MKKIAVITSLLTVMSACTRIAEQDIANALEKNPELLVQAIEKNPDRILEALYTAQERKREQQAKREQVDAEKQKEAEYQNPKKPVLKESYNYRGAANAAITIVEYSDLQCPFCARGNNTIKELMGKYEGKIRVTFKHLPLTSIHPQAMLGAQYFEAISLQNKESAWKFHDTVLDNQDKMSEEYFKSLTKEYKLDLNKLGKDLNSEAIKNKISEDTREAKSFGFSGTPAFLVNGISVSGAQPINVFEGIIKKLGV